jgi:cytochrome c553
MRFRLHRIALVSTVLPIALVIAGCRQSASGQVERGRVLVIAAGCNDCHTTKRPGSKGPEPDMSRMLSGHPEEIKITAAYQPAAGSPWTVGTTDGLTAWSGAWGVSFAANLTPDQNTGLGIWTEGMFIKALKTGKHMATSRDILPPMPWNWYAQLSDDDLKAIFAYLRTIPAITNHVADPLPPLVVVASTQ